METNETAEQHPTPIAATPFFHATAIRGFEGQFVCFEATAAFREGMNTTFADGEITLSRETVLNLMRSLGTSLGERETTERFLGETFGWEF
jgi:hypothetical protein